MRSVAELRGIMESPLLQRKFVEGDNAANPWALPEAALDFLVEVAQELKVASIFEFGSGQSTAAFLKAGFQVTSLEHADTWMEQTRNHLTEEEKSRHTPLIRPLKPRMHGLFPVMDWVIDADLEARLKNADLILVDAPNYCPFRESTLCAALNYSAGALVVLDDIRIPTVGHFCDNLLNLNPDLLHQRIRVGHVFDLFARTKTDCVRVRHGLLDVAKGWRRFFVGRIGF